MLLEARFPPDIRVENEAASLLDAGHEVHLLCTEDDREKIELPASLERSGRPHVPPRRDLSGWRRRVPNISLLWFYDARWATPDPRARRQRRSLRRHPCPRPAPGEDGAACREEDGSFVVADMHENYPMVLPFYTMGKSLSPLGRFLVEPRRWERYEKKSVPTCSAVIAVTDEMRSRLEAIGVPAIGPSSSRTSWTPSDS